jgi:hypothetical protein
MRNRAGEYKTNLSGELQYKSFFPKPLPPIEYDKDIIPYCLAPIEVLGF